MRRWLTRAAQRRPDRVAVEAPDGSITYAELLARAEAATPEPFITAPPGLDFAVALHACLLEFIGVVPLDPRLTDAEREARRDRSGGLSGITAIVYTSGTTGAPKPVAIHPRNVEANALGAAVALGHDPDERWLCPLPLSHVGGLMVLLRSVFYATTAVIDDADRLLRDDVTLASLVPTQLGRLLDAGLREPQNLRAVVLGGAPAAPALLERAAAAGVPVVETYGMTETCSMIAVDGFPLPGAELELADDHEIIVRGPMVAGPGGPLGTGDLGRFDERGRLQVIGRKSDTIITGGENVAPAEIEAVLAAHPDVADAAVIGRPDAEWGEAVVALIVAAEGARPDPEALREFCRERLAGFKVPKAFERVEALPRTASGKLQRSTLS